MEVFQDFLARIDNPQHRAQTEAVLAWVAATFPNLTPAMKWNQPMFTDHGTFINILDKAGCSTFWRE
ncbi:DUF1801 domain-containing protein [Brevibacillus borstelensis]|uniref:DUF1801 domain-containing protein n=1 Tax=Brevibacillus borstelensis TaxID=45462 RepID=UPI0015628D4D|nr:DUF1801 domain-containing protein [Brevibacillus borstelensis]MBE5393793.1 DUF1801 domain-containing protein [Brevibacillus borstelensis]WNF03452.1 DUF1801 domain-containing protein [Brevibacillus borstelensis]